MKVETLIVQCSDGIPDNLVGQFTHCLAHQRVIGV